MLLNVYNRFDVTFVKGSKEFICMMIKVKNT